MSYLKKIELSIFNDGGAGISLTVDLDLFDISADNRDEIEMAAQNLFKKINDAMEGYRRALARMQCSGR